MMPSSSKTARSVVGKFAATRLPVSRRHCSTWLFHTASQRWMKAVGVPCPSTCVATRPGHFARVIGVPIGWPVTGSQRCRLCRSRQSKIWRPSGRVTGSTHPALQPCGYSISPKGVRFRASNWMTSPDDLPTTTSGVPSESTAVVRAVTDPVGGVIVSTSAPVVRSQMRIVLPVQAGGDVGHVPGGDRSEQSSPGQDATSWFSAGRVRLPAGVDRRTEGCAGQQVDGAARR